jgi:Asp-tRNA(Asn)/Glu-tRNA(Gln) amidotransferase A subunit family amidase
MDFRRETLSGLAAKVRSREVSSRELVQHALDRIEELNERINAFVAVDGDAALADAARVDARIAQGHDVGDLAGIPIGVKDLEDAAGYVTTHGSAIFVDGLPAVRDSIFVTRLKDAGCVVVGKTNTPELGYKADTDNPTFGATRNPWDIERSPGGSSGGSAAAVAAGMVPLATGSDGGGSLRIPSSCCGLSGFKPSLGRVPSGGSRPPDWHHLSTKGPVARRMADLALVLDSVIGPDPTDLRSLPMPEPSWLGAIDVPKVPARIAWAPTLGYATVDREIATICERAVGVMADLGAEVVEVERVFDVDPVGSWLVLANTYNLRTLWSVHGSEDWAKIDPGLAAQIEFVSNLPGVEMVKAEDQCHLLNCRLVDLFHTVRLLVTPTIASAPPVSGMPGTIDGEPDVNWVRFTYPFNMTRSPAATVCAGFTSTGLPVGLQMVGPQHADLVVLRAAAALEAALDLDAIAPVDG